MLVTPKHSPDQRDVVKVGNTRLSIGFVTRFFAFFEVLSAFGWFFMIFPVLVMGIWLSKWLGVVAGEPGRFDFIALYVFLTLGVLQLIYHTVAPQARERRRSISDLLRSLNGLARQRIEEWRERSNLTP